MEKNSCDCENTNCGDASKCSDECSSKKNGFHVDAHEKNNIKRVIGVVSGKGGVGKSLVTSMMSVIAKRRGYRVGVLDSDITGPSIPKMFGIDSKPEINEDGIYPVSTEEGIKVMSINLLLDKEDSPVVWRGPLIAGAVKQFWSDVVWGELDYLFIDMPPGTGDVPLTVFQSLPVSGIIIVTSPQELVHLIVKKAYNMAKTMNIPVLGIVENMSYVKCDDCGKEIKLFGESHVEDTASELGIKLLGKMPVDTSLARLCDSGSIERLENEYLSDAMTFIEDVFG